MLFRETPLLKQPVQVSRTFMEGANQKKPKIGDFDFKQGIAVKSHNFVPTTTAPLEIESEMIDN